MITRPAYCPECGIKHAIDIEPGVPMNVARITYSCSHFEQRCRESHCDFCDRLHTPLRQVPYPIPLSLCYCEDCYEKCLEFCKELDKQRRE